MKLRATTIRNIGCPKQRYDGALRENLSVQVIIFPEIGVGDSDLAPGLATVTVGWAAQRGASKVTVAFAQNKYGGLECLDNVQAVSWAWECLV